jgi:tellurite resistance protein TerC
MCGRTGRQHEAFASGLIQSTERPRETTTSLEAMVVVWIAFLVFIFILLALDLGVFHRKAHVVSVREALTWTCVWVALALVFSGFVYLAYDRQWLGLGLTPDPVDRGPGFPDGRLNDGWSAFLKFVTGYIVEESLSVDNVFVIAMLFQYFAVPRQYQHRVLFWGIIGAVVMRGLMIAIGAQLVAQFSWILYVFGGILILTAIKMAFFTGEEMDPAQNFIVRNVRRRFPVTDRYHGEHFFIRAEGTPERGPYWMLTPLALALVMVETTDLIFAVDSIPAIFAITGDPFLVFTSNVFAILGLRSLYFALAGALHALRYMKHALAAVLLVVGVKMLAHQPLKDALGDNFNVYLLGVVVLILGIGVVASLLHRTGNATSQTSSPGAADMKSTK